MNTPSAEQQSHQTSGFGLLIRLYWMLLGYIPLGICAVFIAKNSGRYFSTYDILFWFSAILLILARYLDIFHFHGQTSEGEPATPRHWRRYSIFLAVISLSVWVIAHGVTYLL